MGKSYWSGREVLTRALQTPQYHVNPQIWLGLCRGLWLSQNCPRVPSTTAKAMYSWTP